MPRAVAAIRANPGLSARIDLEEIVLEAAHDHRIARRGIERQFGKVGQRFGMKAGRQSLEPHCRHLPIAVAARTAEQIDLAREAFNKSAAQFRQQLRIIAGSRRQSRVKSS